MTNEKPIISVDMLSKSFDSPDGDKKTEIFGKVCFDIYPGEFVTLIGHSGCGKNNPIKYSGRVKHSICRRCFG